MDDAHAGASPWQSIHSARWHSGDYFVVQDERADGAFDTACLMGWDADADRCFARSIENHGFASDYTMTVEGHTWAAVGTELLAAT